MPRTKPVKNLKKTVPQPSVDNSQTSSDDNYMLGVVAAEQYLLKSEKKNKDNRRKFLETTRQALAQKTDGANEKNEIALKALRDKYEEFIGSYAVNEDKIRRLVAQMKEEQETADGLAEAQARMTTQTMEETEKNRIMGLAMLTSVNGKARDVLKKMLVSC